MTLLTQLNSGLMACDRKGFESSQIFSLKRLRKLAKAPSRWVTCSNEVERFCWGDL